MARRDVTLGTSEGVMHQRSKYGRTQVEKACEVMHDAYEKAAVGAGWETQQASRKPWTEVPEANKATMRAAILALLEYLDADHG